MFSDTYTKAARRRPCAAPRSGTLASGSCVSTGLLGGRGGVPLPALPAHLPLQARLQPDPAPLQHAHPRLRHAAPVLGPPLARMLGPTPAQRASDLPRLGDRHPGTLSLSSTLERLAARVVRDRCGRGPRPGPPARRGQAAAEALLGRRGRQAEVCCPIFPCRGPALPPACAHLPRRPIGAGKTTCSPRSAPWCRAAPRSSAAGWRRRPRPGHQ